MAGTDARMNIGDAAKDTGLPVRTIRCDDGHRSGRAVRARSQVNLAAVPVRPAERSEPEMRLAEMIAQCHGDDAPDGAILDALTDRVGAEG